MHMHGWSYKSTEIFYHIDLTFDEDYSKRIDEPQYMYFNVTDDEISLDHNYKRENYPDIKCNSRKDNYYVRKGLYFNDIEEVFTALSRFIESNHAKEGNVPFYFRMQDELSADIIEEALPEIAQSRVEAYAFSHTIDGYFAFLLKFTQS